MDRNKFIVGVSVVVVGIFLLSMQTPAVSEPAAGLDVPYGYIFAEALGGAKANPTKQEYIDGYKNHCFEFGVDPAELEYIEARYFVNDALVTTTIAVEALESGATSLTWNAPGFPAPPPIHPDYWYSANMIDPESPEFTEKVCEKIRQWWPSYLIMPPVYWDKCGQYYGP